MNNDVDKALGGAMQGIFHKLKERDAMNNRDIRNHALNSAERERVKRKAESFFELSQTITDITRRAQYFIEGNAKIVTIDEALQVFNDSGRTPDAAQSLAVFLALHCVAVKMEDI